MNVLVHFSPIISNSCRSYVLGVILKELVHSPNFVRGGKQSDKKMRWGLSKPPPTNTKYVNCYNFDEIVRFQYIWCAELGKTVF